MYKRKTYDFFLAQPQSLQSFVLAVCTEPILMKFYNYSMENMSEVETHDAIMFDAIETFL